MNVNKNTLTTPAQSSTISFLIFKAAQGSTAPTRWLSDPVWTPIPRNPATREWANQHSRALIPKETKEMTAACPARVFLLSFISEVTALYIPTASDRLWDIRREKEIFFSPTLCSFYNCMPSRPGGALKDTWTFTDKTGPIFIVKDANTTSSTMWSPRQTEPSVLRRPELSLYSVRSRLIWNVKCCEDITVHNTLCNFSSKMCHNEVYDVLL